MQWCCCCCEDINDLMFVIWWCKLHYEQTNCRHKSAQLSAHRRVTLTGHSQKNLGAIHKYFQVHLRIILLEIAHSHISSGILLQINENLNSLRSNNLFVCAVDSATFFSRRYEHGFYPTGTAGTNKYLLCKSYWLAITHSQQQPPEGEIVRLR